MLYAIFDIETNALLDTVTKIHCLTYAIYCTDFDEPFRCKKTLTDYNEIKEFFNNSWEDSTRISKKPYLVGHNITRFDIPLVEKILDVKVEEERLIDTLSASWYLYPLGGKFKHGLGHWGERLDFGKPKVEDWSNQPIKVYIERCEADVEINSRLFEHQMGFLMDIYEDLDEVKRILGYLRFKMLCLRDQERVGITLDKRLAEKSKLDLEFLIEDKMSQLSAMMPKDSGKIVRNRPKVMYKKDENLSAHGTRWLQALKAANLPEDSEVIRDKPNPGSHQQLKAWLFELDWKPITFKVNDKGEKIPQVSLPQGEGLCPSIDLLIEKHPNLEALDGLYKVKHRFGLFKGFLEMVDDKGRVYSKAHGFSSTLRLQHSKPIANLPKPSVFYGKEVRGCLTVPNDKYLMIGSDISGLEDNTKQHYIYKYDPEYVKEMQQPGYDPHMDIGLKAGLVTPEEAIFYKDFNNKDCTDEELKKYEEIKDKRFLAKNSVNFPCTYGAGPKKISEGAGIPFSEGKILFDAYWKRNRGVKQTANACKIRTVRKQKWLYNPVSGFWMFLRADKDRFSTLNQSTGVYVFDTWVYKVRKKLATIGIYIVLQYHDEILIVFEKELKGLVILHLNNAIKDTNDELQLNVNINISIDEGCNYAECH